MIAVDRIAQELKDRSLRLWTFPGGTIYPLYDACHRHGVDVVVARSELGAGYMAIGAAKATGQPQVCAVTSGPGATNVLTCVADAFYDSVPVVFLTGQVATSYLGGSLRQRGFQQTPILKMAAPVTVERYDAPTAFLEALQQANYPRRGPVVVDMPMDLQLEDGPFWTTKLPTPMPLIAADVEDTLSAINGSVRPLILAGMGALASWKEIRELSTKTHIPIVTSLPAVGIVPTGDPLNLGYIGYTGQEKANRAVTECDLLLVLGSRLDIRQTGTEPFAPQARIIRVDIDPDELMESRAEHMSILADCREFLRALIPNLKERKPWAGRHLNLLASQMGLAILQISESAPESCTFSTGVGTHQQEAARHLSLDYPKRMLLTSSGHGCMGAGIPMAVGSSLSTGKPAIVIDGDGSFQMTMSELGTIADRHLDVRINIMQNNAGGIVSQFARSRGYDPIETTWSVPDFDAIGRAYGVEVNVWEVGQEDVLPILESGHSMDDMTW